MGELDGQVGLVTAGAQGIGRAIALKLAGAGADIVITMRKRVAEDPLAREVAAMGKRALSLEMDVTDRTSIERTVEKAVGQFGKVDILVNNAGVREDGLGKTTAQTFDRCYAVNLKGVWQVSQAIAPHFQERGSGKIINIASIFGRRPNASIPAYCASKAALISLTQSLALTLGPFNINVNAVCPGPVMTQNLQEWVQTHVGDLAFLKNYAQDHTALKRLAVADDIGDAVAFLASPRAAAITGQSINVDCGAILS